MGRVYTVEFSNVSVSAAQDLIAVYAGSSKAFKLHSFTLGQVTATAVGNLRVRVNRLTSAVTSGSGGSAGTLIPVGPNDTAATITARVNDTTQATTSGSVQTMVADAFNVVNGITYLPPAEDRITVAPSQALVISLDTVTSGGITMSGYATVEELY